MSRALVVTGTSTDVGKTIVTAALAAALTTRQIEVAVGKPLQTGVTATEPGDLATVTALGGDRTTWEGARYPDPLAPETAARTAGLPQVCPDDLHARLVRFVGAHRLTLVEGAGGVLVRLGTDYTILDVAEAISAPVLVVCPAGLGALNHAELTVAAIRVAGLVPAGLVIGSWPADPDLAMRCNRDDLPRLTGVPLVGAIPAGAGRRSGVDFRAEAHRWFDPEWLDRLATDAEPSAPASPTPLTHLSPREGALP